MPETNRSRASRRVLMFLIPLLVSIGCSGNPPTPVPGSDSAGGQSGTASSANAQEMMAALAEFNRGNALMEQYRYSSAAEAYELVLKKQPEWLAARFNLGLAYLNMQGERQARDSLDIAREKFEQVLELEPRHVASLFCLGMYYQYLGDIQKSLDYFQQAHQEDPGDLYAAYKYAETLLALEQTEQGVQILEQIVAENPGFVSGLYRLAMQYRRAKQMDMAMPLFDRFQKLQAVELAGGSHAVQTSYGAAGKYYRVLDADNLPVESGFTSDGNPIVFSPEVREIEVATHVWDWSGGSISLPGIAVADIDSDGDLDLCLTAQDTEGRVSLWINDGAGNFSSGPVLATQGVSPCFGDVDNDGDADLWLGCTGPDVLLINDGDGNFSPAAEELLGGQDTLTHLSRLLDLDSDGDLDLLAFRAAKGDVPLTADSQSVASSAFSSNRDGTYEDLAETLGLQLPQTSLTSVAFDDLDNDYDLDLILFPVAQPPQVWMNDRMGEFRLLEGQGIGLEAVNVISATCGDPDKDGDRDLLLFTDARLMLVLNDGYGRFTVDEKFTNAFGPLRGSGGQFADMDNDGDLDLIIPDAHRKDGRGPVLLINDREKHSFVNAADADPGLLLAAVNLGGDASCVVADFTADGRCDILLAEAGQKPLLLENLTQGGNWIELDLSGTRPQDNKARSNRSAIGARVEIKTAAIFQQYLVGGSSGPVAAPPLRVHAGLGDQTKVEWLRTIWPDAVLQAELEVAANQVTAVEELNRKTSSCPYLFAWTGERFEFIADFGGVGGLGYFLSPGIFAPPDPTEYLPLPELKPRDGDYVLQSVTPLEEVTYFDEAKLMAVDHPIGTSIYPNEMMAVSADPPAFELFCLRKTIRPLAAVDHRGIDVTADVQHIDRLYAGATDPDHRFTGLAGKHFVELDFGDQLSNVDPAGRLVFVAYGWVEYGYSSTNYAASQAGLRTEAPTIEVLREGRWVELFHEVGYPAGVNHVMTLDVTGRLRAGDRRVRISSNMELYWDQFFLGLHQPNTPLQVREVAARSADLHFLGYPREYSPDGRHPNLCDYGNVDHTAAWKLMGGNYTRYGEVAELLTAADDCFVVMGHGEEITLRFPAEAFGPIPEGCTRSFLLKTDSYCKDMDLYTAFPERVEPLPFHGMSGYPYGSEESYPDNETTRQYRRRYNTREVLGP